MKKIFAKSVIGFWVAFFLGCLIYGAFWGEDAVSLAVLLMLVFAFSCVWAAENWK